MFAFVRPWFREKIPVPVPKAAVRRGAHRIPYHPDLISELKDEHQALVQLLEELSVAVEKDRTRKIPKILHEFGVRLRAHLLKENVQLYVYLDRNLANDPDNHALIHDLKREMMHIGRSVNRFLEHYMDHEWDAAGKDRFEKDFAQLTEILGQRIQLEESDLYTLYLPPESYGVAD